MQDSILDKVITSKQINEMQEFQPAETLNILLKKLSAKEADVLRRRFGLQESEIETLENIGLIYKVTRERIRQIENLAIKKLKELPDFSSLVEPVGHVLHMTFHASGGFLTEEKLHEKLLPNPKDTESNKRAISFLLNKLLGEKFSKHAETEHTRSGWKIFSASVDFLHNTLEHLHDVVHTHSKPQTFDEIYGKFREKDYFREHQEKLNEDVVGSFLDLSHRIGMNPFGEYGLREWGAIIPKRMNDKIYLILKKTAKPLHFTEIANMITKTFKKRAYPPTVHNELILNEEYILVGRGMYALKEWGYKKGVVADVLIEILKNADKPLAREELVETALKQRVVKRNTIHLALTNKKLFRRNADNTYELIAEEQTSEENSQ